MLARIFATALLLPVSLCCGSQPRVVAAPAASNPSETTRVPGFEAGQPTFAAPAPPPDGAAALAQPAGAAASASRLECERIRNAAPDSHNLPSPIGIPEIYDPSGAALAPLFSALGASAGGRAVTRIMYFGDSHVAADAMTGRIRRNLQTRFGNAGVGFVMPAKPARWYAHELLEFTPASGWAVLSVRKPDPLARYAGPSGFALHSTGVSRATVRLHEVAPDARFELFFLRQPDGGTVQASFDGQSSTSWSTRGTLGAGYAELGVSPAPHLISIDTPGDGVVTLFGLTLEHGESGVVLDTLGIPGARARDHLLWNEPLYREHLRKRNPALVVMAYGTNEGMDGDEPLELYESQAREVIRRVRSSVPAASCLLVGPTDHPLKSGRASFSARRRTGQIVKAQRKIAAESGCAFIDLVAVTGGPMSMMRLVQAHLGARDHTHFTRKGYEALGDAISAALVGKYLAWQRATCREPGATASVP